MDQSLGTSKWSRNLSEDSQSESNRLRLIERQRQLLESKLQRQHQVIATTSRPSTGRNTKSALSGQRSTEKLLIDLEDVSSASAASAGGAVNAGLSKGDEYNYNDSAKDQIGSVGAQKQVQSQSHVQSIQNLSPLSSPQISSITSKAKSDMISGPQINRSDRNSGNNLNVNIEKSVSTPDLVQLNPLSTILSNEELLVFATQPISPQTTLQCTIIRDKKGIDRSLYPTYYMHLQAIVPNTELDKSDKSSEQSSPKSSLELVNITNEGSLNSQSNHSIYESAAKGNDSGSRGSHTSSNTGGYRQVFILSGRRRKKSKTYIIGNDPFDISRGNCIAKLKSNVLGTQFTAIRVNANGQRQEIATIIYETNVLGFKGPRRMTALIPKYDQLNALKNSSVFEEWKRNNKAIIQLKNKTPVWNDETQSYVLNFRGRVTQASVKNFQLVTCHEKEDIMLSSPTNQSNASNVSNESNPSFAPTIPTTQPIGESCGTELVSMQFGRVSGSQFSCDVSWPMSLLQAFAIALSSFDSKLACE